MKVDQRSPIKDRPLRNPGQSLEGQRDLLITDKLLTPFIIAIVLCALAGMEWWAYYRHLPRQPVTYTVIAVLAVAYCIWNYLRFKPKFSKLRLAIHGERTVGQYLDRLREQHYEVFHDVIGKGFNVDHVIIGPPGIFTVETKMRSKPARGEAKIIFNGETIAIDGVEPDRDPIIQGKAQSRWLKGLLTESTGRIFEVRPVVVFPGWWIEQRPGSTRQVWVLEPKALPGFLANEPVVLVPEDIKLASFHISRFIRTQRADS